MALTKIDDRGLKTPIDLLDNEKIRFGTGNDLEIYHDGSDSYIAETGTGSLSIKGSPSIGIRSATVNINNEANSENMARFFADGAVELYHDNFKSFETYSNGITVYGPEGSAGIVQIFSDDGDDNGDKWRLIKEGGNENFSIQNYKSGSWETNIKTTGDGNVELYHDNVKTFETQANGITVLGPEGGDAEVRLKADEGDDNADLWRINADTGGVFQIQNYTAGSWEANIECNGNGNVELYYDSNKKLETVSDGIQVTGNEASEARLYLYADDGDDNADKIHLATDTSGNLRVRFFDGSNWNTQWQIQSDGSLKGGDGKIIYLGSGNDLQIYHDGSDSYIKDDGTGDLLIRGDDVKIQGTDGNTLFIGTNGAGGALWYSGAGSAAVTAVSGGADVTGKLNVESAGGGDYVAHFRNGTSATPYTVHIQEPNSPGAGYPLLNVTNNGGTTEWLRVDSTRGVTKLKMHDGAGIDFSATSSAAGMTSELLDSYEEGSWSPSLNEGTANWAFCKYVRIGRQVQIWGRMDSPTAGSSTQIEISGIPFNANQSSASGSLLAKDVNNTDATTVYINSSHKLYFYGISSGNSWTNTTFADCTTNTEIYFHGTYLTD